MTSSWQLVRVLTTVTTDSELKSCNVTHSGVRTIGRAPTQTCTWTEVTGIDRLRVRQVALEQQLQNGLAALAPSDTVCQSTVP